MPKLLIVESPTKCKTISHYLGSDYIVKASMGHVCDLSERGLGVDIQNDFKPDYVVSADKKQFVKELQKDAAKSDEVFLAPDPDREGEAIAWHIANCLGDEAKGKIKRVQFNEITKKAIQAAIENPRDIDMDRVNAQQARRILDRVVGFKVSPILWRTLYKGLSAGRVQSVALRIICEREEEIRAFNSQEYWMLTASFSEQKTNFSARLVEYDGKKLTTPDDEKKGFFVNNEGLANEIFELVKNKPMSIKDVVKQEKKRQPYAPFITSSLQQDAARAFGFSSAKTMQVAQQLYEGVALGSKGSVGLITYMRTDSTRVSNEALFAVKNVISSLFDERYVSAKPRFYGKSGNAQDAHEAIRPANVEVNFAPNNIAKYLTNDQLKLYGLIWKRFVASQMPDAILDSTRVDFEVENCVFRANGSVIKFDGFLAVYEETNEEISDNGDNGVLPPLSVGQSLTPSNIEKKQHFTKPPARFSEATLVRELEKQGIGRPSTYASIIEVLRKRKYAEMEKKRFVPTEIGFKVNSILVQNFDNIFAVGFTANMETKLDDIEAGKSNWITTLKEFYTPFEHDLSEVLGHIKELKAQNQEFSDKTCPNCNSQLLIKTSKNGKFLACPNFPDCKHTESLDGESLVEESDEVCEKCGSKMLIRAGRNGKFLACSAYPKCKNAKSMTPPTGIKCPKCIEGDIVERNSKRGSFFACNNYPKCDFVIWNKPVKEACPHCSCAVVNEKETKKDGVIRICPMCSEAWDLSGNKVEVAKKAPRATKVTPKKTTSKKTAE